MLMRSLPLPPPEGGHLVVIDDLTRQMQAEREATWEEASRRFAHEIKNPLTPIQLAAERMGEKTGRKIAKRRHETLRRGLFTIVKQAEAMGQMVDSFRRYAGRRALNRAAVDLNQLAREVADLYAGREAEVSFSPHPQPLPVWADAVCCVKCCTICSPTPRPRRAPPPTKGRRESKYRSRALTRKRRASRFWTAATASTKTFGRACSSPTRRRNTAAPAWAWPKRAELSINIKGKSR